MTLPEFQAWQRLASKRVLQRRNTQAREDWNARIEEMKRRGL